MKIMKKKISKPSPKRLQQQTVEVLVVMVMARLPRSVPRPPVTHLPILLRRRRKLLMSPKKKNNKNNKKNKKHYHLGKSKFRFVCVCVCVCVYHEH